MFCDYTAATNQPALPSTLAALSGFLTQLPARDSTQARRVAAITAAHRHAGYLPPRRTAPIQTQTFDLDRCDGRPDPGQLIASCPTRGWPHGLRGRRDGFLIVLTRVLAYSHTQARHLQPGEITACTELTIGDRVVPATDDPRSCPTCAALRWFDILGIADGLGRGSARTHLCAATAPTSASPHQHSVSDPPRWRQAAQLLPAIDRHGWIEDYRPLSTRSIHTRLTLAAHRATSPAPTHTEPRTHHPPTATDPARQPPTLEEVLTLLDQVADDADAVNHRIQALLAEHTPRHT